MPRIKLAKEYGAWWNMKDRCDNPKHVSYADYGGRGIGYDESWKDFQVFLADVGEAPGMFLTLERKDNNKGYSKENCCWATQTAQNHNQRLRKDSTSGVKGVSWKKRDLVWEAYFAANRKTTTLYRGPDLIDAVAARKRWENQSKEN